MPNGTVVKKAAAGRDAGVDRVDHFQRRHDLARGMQRDVDAPGRERADALGDASHLRRRDGYRNSRSDTAIDIDLSSRRTNRDQERIPCRSLPPLKGRLLFPPAANRKYTNCISIG
jgi:hypothetical protein